MLLRFSLSSKSTPRILAKLLGMGKEQLSSICMLEIILDIQRYGWIKFQ